MTATKRIRIFPADRQQMEDIISSAEESELQKAYMEMLNGCLEHPKEWNWYAIWIIENEEGVHIGDLCFKGYEDGKNPEIGYGINDEFQGKGYATEAVKLALEWAFNHSGVEAVEAETNLNNIASQKVLEKCGFKATGTIGVEGPRFIVYREEKYMLSFESDYIEGAHPLILDSLAKTNMECLSGYGKDHYTKSAKEKIAAACGLPDAQIFFLTGGTQTNQIIIDTMLRQYEGVISAQSGHVSVHEAGAIEFTGRKVLTLPQHNGKIDASELDSYISDFYADDSHEHMIFPGLVYISHPTEYGTLYSKKEMTDISEVCHKHRIPLYIDGARLGYGLMSRESDLTLNDIARLCDVFYIGGTKAGALCGEAVVFTKNNMPLHFENLVKKHGALLAKGRLLGIQFDTLFTNDLYFKISRNAVERAEELKNLFVSNGYKLFMDSPTNQQFIILENSRMQELQKKVQFTVWEKYDENHSVVRFATSWATTKEKIAELEKVLLLR